MGGWGFVLVNRTPILAKIVRGRPQYPREGGGWMDNVKSCSVPETVAVLRAVPRKCVCARVCAPLQWNFSNFAGLVVARSRERDGMMHASRTIIGLILGNKPLRVCCGARSLERNGKQNDSNCMKKLIKKHTQMNNYKSLSATSAGKSARAHSTTKQRLGWAYAGNGFPPLPGTGAWLDLYTGADVSIHKCNTNSTVCATTTKK